MNPTTAAPNRERKKHCPSVCQTHTRNPVPVSKKKTGGRAAQNNHTHTGGDHSPPDTHTHTPHGKSAKKNESAQTRRDGSRVVGCPRPDGRRTRVSSFVCDMRVLFADPVSRCPGIGIWFLALQLVLALLGEKSNGYSVSKCREWGEMTIVFFSLQINPSTEMPRCPVGVRRERQ